jgi:hypothetical protein
LRRKIPLSDRNIAIKRGNADALSRKIASRKEKVLAWNSKFEAFSEPMVQIHRVTYIILVLIPEFSSNCDLNMLGLEIKKAIIGVDYRLGVLFCYIIIYNLIDKCHSIFGLPVVNDIPLSMIVALVHIELSSMFSERFELAVAVVSSLADGVTLKA